MEWSKYRMDVQHNSQRLPYMRRSIIRDGRREKKEREWEGGRVGGRERGWEGREGERGREGREEERYLHGETEIVLPLCSRPPSPDHHGD